MNDLRTAAQQALEASEETHWKPALGNEHVVEFMTRFAALVAAAEREACIDIIETYRIPVGNSAAGEMACEWTYDALHEIRDAIRARGEK